MALRVVGGGGGGGRGGGGRGGKKNRPTPYGKALAGRQGGGGGGAPWNRGDSGGLVPPEEGGAAPAVGTTAPQTAATSAGNRPKMPPHPSTKKFTNRARLFFGNLPRDFSEDELKKMLTVHGEVQEIYHSKEKNFAFARMAYRSEAEQVILHHNGQTLRNRDIKVRFAASSASIKVSNLNPCVSNELLTEAFSRFGDVEEAVVATDDRGKPLGYGIVDFARKGQAMSAIQQCRKDPFLLTKSPVPVVVTEMVRDNEEGLPEKDLIKNNAYHFEREAPPRFPQPRSLEFDVAQRWKAFFDQEKNERDKLEDKVRGMKSAIQNDMDTIKEQHQTLVLRQEIARHQLEQQRLAERLREQEQRLKGLNAAQNSMGLLPPFSGPAPLFPPIMGPGDPSRPPDGEMPPLMGHHPPPHMPMGGPPLFNPPPLMGPGMGPPKPR